MKPDHGIQRLASVALVSIVLAIVAASEQPARAQISFDREPINYSASEVNDPVAQLQRRMDKGQIELKWDEEHGYLKSVLAALDISPSSQMLVFSKTSFQLRRIAPWTPRALYFNDSNYIGWVSNGEVIEVSSVDARQGAVFYSMRQDGTKPAKFVRDQGSCLVCHASSRTEGVPGHLVRSVYPAPSGQPNFGSGTFRTNHASPLKQRWGGWYVSGTHGRQRHMGNVTTPRSSGPENLDMEAGANITDLSKLTRTDLYLSPHSDIVALMVLEHQTEMHNHITFASYETRLANHHCDVMNRALQRPEDFVSASTQRRIASATEKLIKYMLFSDEFALTDEIKGTSNFTEHFAALGQRDKKGRSLRDFDLKRRIFKYPCSYLIYSDSFKTLPADVKSQVYRRLWEVLSGKDQSKSFSHLTAVDRKAIYEILLDTSSDLPEYWKTAAK